MEKGFDSQKYKSKATVSKSAKDKKTAKIAHSESSKK